MEQEVNVTIIWFGHQLLWMVVPTPHMPGTNVAQQIHAKIVALVQVAYVLVKLVILEITVK